MRLLDAKELERQVKEAFAENPCVMGIMLRWIRKQPTIEAEPVEHGRWIDTREWCGDYMCSNCDALYGTNKFNYCPNCGAKMDEEG